MFRSHTCSSSAVFSRPAWLAGALVALIGSSAMAQDPAQAPVVTPELGQPGKDVVWVPSPNETIAMMLDLARVTPDDYVIDLGSGDGRTVIAAAQRGARALGVEYNPDLVTFSRQEAVRAGVVERARFVEGDMYEADVSEATVLALFLLTENLRTLAPTFLALRPGTRIVSNTFAIPDWKEEETARLDAPCMSWCTALLYVVPANVAGRWRMATGDLELTQEAQVVSGTWSEDGRSVAIADGAVRADLLRFSLEGAVYEGRVDGDTITGTRRDAAGVGSPWATSRSPVR